MPTICPKCDHVRPPDTQAPDWQCPACGVVYAKANQAPYQPAAPRREIHGIRTESDGSWGKWLVMAVLVAGAWFGLRQVMDHGAEVSSHRASRGAAMTEQALRELAVGVSASDVVIYTTTHCPYCAQAKEWMSRYGFAFTECNAETDGGCVKAPAFDKPPLQTSRPAPEATRPDSVGQGQPRSAAI